MVGPHALEAYQAFTRACCGCSCLSCAGYGKQLGKTSVCLSFASIKGTVLWVALFVLEGAQHSLSSMLEGLFVSALSISCNGKLHLWHAMKPDQPVLCAA